MGKQNVTEGKQNVTDMILDSLQGMGPDQARLFLDQLKAKLVKPAPAGTTNAQPNQPFASGLTADELTERITRLQKHPRQNFDLLKRYSAELKEQLANDTSTNNRGAFKRELQAHSKDMGGGVVALDVNLAKMLSRKYGIADYEGVMNELSSEFHSSYIQATQPAPASQPSSNDDLAARFLELMTQRQQEGE